MNHGAAPHYEVRARTDGQWEYGMSMPAKQMPKTKKIAAKQMPHAKLKTECAEPKVNMKKEDADEIDVIGPLAAPVETGPDTDVKEKDDGPPDPQEMEHYNTCSAEAHSESEERDDMAPTTWTGAAAKRRERRKRALASSTINYEKRVSKKRRDQRWFLRTYAPDLPVPPHLQRGTSNS